MSKSLEQLIDEAMASGQWYGIAIFAGKKDGPRVNMLRDIATAQCDQIVDPDVPASVRLRIMLEAAEKVKVKVYGAKVADVPKPEHQAALFDDLL